MAFTFTEQAELADTANIAAYVTASYTPNPNRILVGFYHVTASATDPPTISGNGLTWTLQNSASRGAGRVGAFTAPTGSSPSAGGCTVDMGADPGTNGYIHITEVDGIDLASPVVQSITNSSIAAAGTPTFTFSGATGATCAIIANAANLSNPPTLTPPSGYTELMDAGTANVTSGMEVVYHGSPGAVTTVTWGNTSATVCTVIGLELRAATAAPGAFRRRHLPHDQMRSDDPWAIGGWR